MIKKILGPIFAVGVTFWALAQAYARIYANNPISAQKKHQYLKKKPKNLPHANSPRCTKKKIKDKAKKYISKNMV